MAGQQFIELMFPKNSEVLRLLPGACSPSIEQGLKAATKDPLWYLARQWQMGEFRATNGGMPVRAEVAERTAAIEEVRLGANMNAFAKPAQPGLPLEKAVESPGGAAVEDDSFNGAWSKKQLEYRFAVKAGDIELASEEYAGGNLDWFDFDVECDVQTRGTVVEHTVLPAKVTFKGAPNTRFWRFEEGNVDLGDISRPDLNPVAMALIEFSMIYGNDWFSLPLPQKAGSVRSILELDVIDSFGQRTPIPPTVDTSAAQSMWSLYTLSKPGGGAADSRLFVLADRVAAPMQGEPLEEVTFFRDESVNLVWAIEHRYLDGKSVVNRDDVEAAHQPAAVRVGDDVPVYRLKSHVPRNWIPYIAMKVSKTDEGIVLRRGRSDENAGRNNPQYKGELLKDARIINEEEIPSVPLRVTRHWKLVAAGPETWRAVNESGRWKLVRIKNKQVVSWVGREKKTAPRQPASNLIFDFLVEK